MHICDRGQNGGCEQICNKKGNQATCSCKKGFDLSEDGKSCEEVHPCDIANGGCQQKCERKGNTARCACEDGFTLEEDGKSCEKIHPCDQDEVKVCDQICNKKQNKYECSCKVDFKLANDSKTCVEGESCDILGQFKIRFYILPKTPSYFDVNQSIRKLKDMEML